MAGGQVAAVDCIEGERQLKVTWKPSADCKNKGS